MSDEMVISYAAFYWYENVFVAKSVLEGGVLNEASTIV